MGRAATAERQRQRRACSRRRSSSRDRRRAGTRYRQPGRRRARGRHARRIFGWFVARAPRRRLGHRAAASTSGATRALARDSARTRSRRIAASKTEPARDRLAAAACDRARRSATTTRRATTRRRPAVALRHDHAASRRPVEQHALAALVPARPPGDDLLPGARPRPYERPDQRARTSDCGSTGRRSRRSRT